MTIPADEGTYYFEVMATIQTKTSFDSRLVSFEFRVIVDGNITDRQIVNVSLMKQHIQKGEIFKTPFTVPANMSSGQRTITVEALKATDSDYYQYHVDNSDDNRTPIWQAIQPGR